MSIRSSAVLVAAATLFLTGCATPLPAPGDAANRATQTLPNPLISVEWATQSDANDYGQLLAEATQQAQARCESVGHLSKPFRIVVYPSSKEVRTAIGREHLKWVAAWTNDEEMALVSPRTWGDKKAWQQLVIHELTHAIHHQSAGIPSHRSKANDPLWFREGLAIFMAQQGSDYPSESAIRAKLVSHPSIDLLEPSQQARQTHQRTLYGGGFYMVSRLLEQRGGLDALKKFMQLMTGGLSFEAAMSAAFGITPRAHLQEWMNSSPALGSQPRP